MGRGAKTIPARSGSFHQHHNDFNCYDDDHHDLNDYDNGQYRHWHNRNIIFIHQFFHSSVLRSGVRLPQVDSREKVRFAFKMLTESFALFLLVTFEDSYSS